MDILKLNMQIALCVHHTHLLTDILEFYLFDQ